MEARQKAALAILLLAITLSSAVGAGYFYGYERAEDIASFPCLGCLGLNPVFSSGGFVKADFAQPPFVLLALQDGPVFLHYRTDICPACDEMEPVVSDVESDYTGIATFIHINLDHATAEEVASYDLYDSQTPGAGRTGVPMFTIVYADGEGGYMYSTSYGVLEASDLGADIEEAAANHNGGEVPIVVESGLPVIEMFVDTLCVNCPDAEEETVLQMLEGNVAPIIYVTDAGGRAGAVAQSREASLASNITFLGHPFIVFGYGEVGLNGWSATTRTQYFGLLDDYPPLGLNSTMELTLERDADGITVNATGVAGADCVLRLFIQEASSRYLNRLKDPIPMVALDARNWATPAGDYSVSWNWSGAAGMSWASVDPAGLVVTAVLMRDWEPVLTRTARFDSGWSLSLTSDVEELALTPSTNGTVALTLSNPGDATVHGEFVITSDPYKPAPRITPSNFTLGPGDESDFVLTVGAGAAVDEWEVSVIAIPEEFQLAGDSVGIPVFVREEIVKPMIFDVSISPEEPRTGDSPVITFKASDASGLSSVRVEWFICTDKLCDPLVIVQVNESGGVYSCQVDPVPYPYTSLHYNIVAVDTHGNENETGEYDVEVSLVSKGKETPMPGLAAAVALLAAVAAAELWRRR